MIASIVDESLPATIANLKQEALVLGLDFKELDKKLKAKLVKRCYN